MPKSKPRRRAGSPAQKPAVKLKKAINYSKLPADDRWDVPNLGTCKTDNPALLEGRRGAVHDTLRIAIDPTVARGRTIINEGFELAGPREKIFFTPAKTKVAIVTCGGICPGINAVVRALVLQLFDRYGVRSVQGVRYGYQGLSQATPSSFLALSPENVSEIHFLGGTILGTSRGTPETTDIVDRLAREKIDILFSIGGDGTMRGATAIWQEVSKRKLNISVIGIPKTIDNDIPWVKRSFGFETAVEKACDAIESAYTESVSVRGGIGLVKLMGRHAGFIAANAVLANGMTDICLVPEVPFTMAAFSKNVAALLDAKGHAVIVAAEGSGQNLMPNTDDRRDESGNRKLGNIGEFLRKGIEQHVTKLGHRVGIKYIDPSYIIRSSKANANDQLYCARLAQNAVHAAMAGKTGMLVGYWHGRMTHVPLTALAGEKVGINPHGELWRNVRESTGQRI